jgi:CRISPR-associated Csx2 family protein
LLIDDGLIERIDGGDSEIFQELEVLQDKVASGPVGQEDLDHLSALLTKALGISFAARVIPIGDEADGQIELLRIMANEVGDRDRVNIDITHGFRYLPMIALTSALHLQSVKNANVEGFWYGALGSSGTSGTTVRLTGLLKIAESVRALTTYDKDGDYSAFSSIFSEVEPKGSNIATLLDSAAFYENTLNFRMARDEIKKLIVALENHQNRLPGELQLIVPEILRRVKWAEKDNIESRIASIVRTSLSNGDYLRSVIVLYEGIVASICEANSVDPTSYEGREKIRKQYEEFIKESGSNVRPYYTDIKSIRNALAHGNDARSSNIAKRLSDPQLLGKTIEETLAHFVKGSFRKALQEMQI